MPNAENEVKKELSDQEKLFVEMYLVHNQKAKAARLAGYSEATDRQAGYNVYNRPHVRAHIETILEERTLSAKETIKLVSDMAEFNLADYYSPVKRIRTHKVIKPLTQLIEEEREYIRKQEIFIERKGLTEKQFDEAYEALQWRHDQILRWQIELESNPDATEIVDSDPELVDEMHLDMNRLVEDKERGRIKKIKYGKDGLEVEAYDAKAAADTLLKVHGAFEKDNEQKKDVIHINITKDESTLGE